MQLQAFVKSRGVSVCVELEMYFRFFMIICNSCCICLFEIHVNTTFVKDVTYILDLIDTSQTTGDVWLPEQLYTYKYMAPTDN